MIVQLAHTKLTIDVQPERVFPGDADSVRYAAWDSRLDRDSEKVYRGVTDEGKCFVVLHEHEYNDLRPPRPVSTKEQDDCDAAEIRRIEKLRAEKKARETGRKVLYDRYEWVSKLAGGVDYGVEQRVLIRTPKLILTHRKGYSAYLNRGSGTSYQPVEMIVYEYQIPAEGYNQGRVVPHFPGKPLPLNTKFHLCPKNLMGIHATIEKAMGLEPGTLDRSLWRGEKTLVLE